MTAVLQPRTRRGRHRSPTPPPETGRRGALPVSAAPSAVPPRPAPAPSPDVATLMEALPVPVLLVDGRGRIRYNNGAAEPFFGCSRLQLGALSLFDLVPADNPLFLLLSQVSSSGNTVVEHELALEGPRLRRHGVTVQGSALPEAPDFVLLCFHDASAARALDRQLSFRSGARSVSGMAAVLAHEVKNPLSGIRGAAQLLEGSVAEPDRELAVLIRDEADRIRALVERMEVFGEKPIERRPVNIHRVLEHVRVLASRGFADGLRFVEQYDPSLPPVWGDRDQLIQVLLNLVKNAAEAIRGGTGGSGGGDAPPGEIVLGTAYRSSVRLAVPGSPARLQLPLVVTVRDNGPGLPDSIRPHLFEPFLTTKAQGSGLGLALAAKIVGDHGGLIEVDSRPGRTEFILHLPVVAEERGTP